MMPLLNYHILQPRNVHHLTTSAAANIDLVYYSDIGGSNDNIEAASNKYFELLETEEESPEDPLQEKTE